VTVIRPYIWNSVLLFNRVFVRIRINNNNNLPHVMMIKDDMIIYKDKNVQLREKMCEMSEEI